MDLIEYANKFIELEWLIKAVYGGTEKGIYIEELGDFDECFINADIPNWIVYDLSIIKPSKNSKGYVPRDVETLKGIVGKYPDFSFRVDSDSKKYLVSGFRYW